MKPSGRVQVRVRVRGRVWVRVRVRGRVWVRVRVRGRDYRGRIGLLMKPSGRV